MNAASLVDHAPTARLLLMAALAAMLPLAWVWLRQRQADTVRRLAALTALTLFLTFDLVVFGAFTRLSDSGLGCPDWPGCYGEASPLGARDEIHAAQAVMPDGPVTWAKAWIEMIHRYLAMTVGALILVIAIASMLERRRLPHSVLWPVATLGWVVVQGLFGRYTVTLKLYPAVVTLHLLGGLLLLVLLAFQSEAHARRSLPAVPPLRRLAWGALALVFAQCALGGWVSTNYAVLACTGFPKCNGQWWPAMDLGAGFTLLRELGLAGHGGALPFEALVAIQMVHRLVALAVTFALVLLVLQLRRSHAVPLRRFGAGLAGLLLLQWASGVSNVVLGWPLLAALGHSAGAAALVTLLALLLARTAPLRQPSAAASLAPAA